jgi:hypothetical protein
MRKVAFEPCIPTRGTKVPAGSDWFHEIKHDGYRLIVQREGKRVRLLTRRGHRARECLVVIRVITKGGVPRVLPLSREAYEIVWRRRGQHDTHD